ncbi:MAG: serine protease [Vicinamibacterales bacterium]
MAGIVDVRLRPGNYTIESDQPVALGGTAYQWTVTIDVSAAGTLLVLNAANADPGSAADATGPEPAPRVSNPSMTLQQWTPAVVAVWTPTTRVSGFMIDARGLVATSQRAIGAARDVEVQLSTTIKVAGRVVLSNADRDVAIVAVSPSAVSSIRPLMPSCGADTAAVSEGDELFAMGIPLRAQQDSLSSGEVKRAAQGIEADLRLAAGAVGGPVFTSDGILMGLSSPLDDPDAGRRLSAVVPIQRLCELMASARDAADAAAVSDAHLPVEPQETPSPAIVSAQVKARAGALAPLQISSSDFDIAFITPIMVYGAQQPLSERRTTSADTHRPPQEELRVGRQMEFENWTDYVSEHPQVLLVRVTPKMTEGFWRTFARGAAMTQGIVLPSMAQAKARLARMQAFCGDTEITPVHALTIATPIAKTEAFTEGLYAYTPDALSPRCGAVRLVLFSEKEPQRGETRSVDSVILSRIEQDFR